MISSDGLRKFVNSSRVVFSSKDSSVRTVYISELARNGSDDALETYISDKAPLFYRDPQRIANTLGSGYFLTAVRETLLRIPSSDRFKQSHFGEITSTIFAEEVMGLRKVYSKLTQLTAENSNAYKMDAVLYDPNSEPLEFILGEVKSSPKTAAEGFPAKHDKSCFSSIFTSLRNYTRDDLKFDLAAAKDHVNTLPEAEREKVRKALLPYATRKISYAAFAVIDVSTRHDDEISLLATRRNDKDFDVDLVCVEGFPQVAQAVYGRLEKVRAASS